MLHKKKNLAFAKSKLFVRKCKLSFVTHHVSCKPTSNQSGWDMLLKNTTYPFYRVDTILGFLCSKISVRKLSIKMSMFYHWVFLYRHISNWLNKLTNSSNNKMKIIICIYLNITSKFLILQLFIKPIDLKTTK